MHINYKFNEEQSTGTSLDWIWPHSITQLYLTLMISCLYTTELLNKFDIQLFDSCSCMTLAASYIFNTLMIAVCIIIQHSCSITLLTLYLQSRIWRRVLASSKSNSNLAHQLALFTRCFWMDWHWTGEEEQGRLHATWCYAYGKVGWTA